MNYNNLTLGLLCLLGIFIHNLIELNKINKKSGGKAKLSEYLNLEKYAILLSVVISATAVIISQEIKELEYAGKWLGFGYVAVGYMGQSLVIAAMGKASSTLGLDKPEGE